VRVRPTLVWEDLYFEVGGTAFTNSRLVAGADD